MTSRDHEDTITEVEADIDVFSAGSSDDETTAYTGIDSALVHKVGLDAATSIIGGSPVYHHIAHATSDIDEISLSNNHHTETTTSDLEERTYKNSHKIFTFTLPLGGNPLAHLPSLKQLKHSMSIVADSSDEENEFNVTLTREEIKAKLARQESIDTLQEAFLFKGNKGQGRSRFKAVKRALTPTLSLPSLLDEERKKDSVWDTIDGDIVLLGGYRGSKLVETKTSKRVWIPFRAGFKFGSKIDLRIGPTDEDEIHASEEICSDGMLTHIGPVDIARSLKRRLKNGKTRVRTFGYDWRLSSDINSDRLMKYLQLLKKSNKNGKSPLVIAHSMGGLISHHVMQRDPSLFRGLIYVGVPSECPNILGPIRFGDPVLFSNDILTPEANFFMRSSFVFLPINGRCFIDKRTHKKYNLDFFDPEVWSEHDLSPLVSKERASDHDIEQLPAEMKRSFSKQNKEFITSYQGSKDYLARTLKRTRKFIDELEYDMTKKYPPLVIVYGNQVPTVRGARVSGIEGIKRGEYNDFYYGPGDGVVNHKWLMPERKGFPVQAKIASDQGHISLLTDLVAMGEAIEEVLLAERLHETVTNGA